MVPKTIIQYTKARAEQSNLDHGRVHVLGSFVFLWL